MIFGVTDKTNEEFGLWFVGYDVLEWHECNGTIKCSGGVETVDDL